MLIIQGDFIKKFNLTFVVIGFFLATTTFLLWVKNEEFKDAVKSIFIEKFILLKNFKNNFFSSKSDKESENTSQSIQIKEVWLNIFIHGTVGSTFSFFNFSSIKQDRIEHTSYKKMVGMMRKDRFMFQDQAIFDKGLVEINPNIEFCFERKKVCYAAYPILNLFDQVLNFCEENPKEVKNFYYLFGWSGFLSQKRRRLEAVRCYNQLFEKIKFYQHLGFNPKIRILAHSHGGNLALNLAGVFTFLNSQEQVTTFYDQFDIGPYIQSSFDNLLQNLPEKEVAFSRKGQKKFDYPPEAQFKVDELVMFGTPLQEETILFALSDFFKITYNLYSDSDVVQVLDFATTIKRQSLQRIENFGEMEKKFCQVKLQIDSPKISRENLKITNKFFSKKKPSTWWQVVLGLRDTTRQLPDPTHRELWFIVGEDQSPFNFLRPIPFVCFYPIVRKLQQTNDCYDAVCIIDQVENEILFKFKPIHEDSTKTLPQIALKKENFLDMKEKLKPWVGIRSNMGGFDGIMRKIIRMEKKYNY